jgi:hypothetical protein
MASEDQKSIVYQYDFEATPNRKGFASNYKPNVEKGIAVMAQPLHFPPNDYTYYHQTNMIPGARTESDMDFRKLFSPNKQGQPSIIATAEAGLPVATRWPFSRVDDQTVNEFDMVFSVDAQKLSDLIPSERDGEFEPVRARIDAKRLQRFLLEHHQIHTSHYDMAVSHISVVDAQNINTHSGFDVSLKVLDVDNNEIDFLKPRCCRVTGGSPNPSVAYTIPDGTTSRNDNNSVVFSEDRKLSQTETWQRWANQDLLEIRDRLKLNTDEYGLFYKFKLKRDSAGCVDDPVLCVALHNMPAMIDSAKRLGAAYASYDAQSAFEPDKDPDMPITVFLPIPTVDTMLDKVATAIEGPTSLMRLSTLCVEFTPTDGWSNVRLWQDRRVVITPAFDHNPSIHLNITLRFVGRFMVSKQDTLTAMPLENEMRTSNLYN